MIEFQHSVALKATLLLAVVLTLLLTLFLQAEAAVIKDLRIGNNDGYVRMVLEFDRPLTTTPLISVNHDQLAIGLTGIVNTLSTPRIEAQQDDIIGLDVSKPSGEIRIEAVFSFIPADIKTFTLTGPHRFIIDAYRPLPDDMADRSVEIGDPKTADKSIRAMPEPYRIPESSNTAGMSSNIVEASLDVYGALAAKGLEAARADRSQFQQRLVAGLIIVTSVIVVLLFILIRIGGRSGPYRKRRWRDHLPQTTDPAIESIDSEIREHLKSYDHK